MSVTSYSASLIFRLCVSLTATCYCRLLCLLLAHYNHHNVIRTSWLLTDQTTHKHTSDAFLNFSKIVDKYQFNQICGKTEAFPCHLSRTTAQEWCRSWTRGNDYRDSDPGQCCIVLGKVPGVSFRFCFVHNISENSDTATGCCPLSLSAWDRDTVSQDPNNWLSLKRQ